MDFYFSNEQMHQIYTSSDFGEVSFLPRGGLLKIGGIRYFFLDQKGGSKDFFKLKKEITYIF